jgi:hypothetical protein
MKCSQCGRPAVVRISEKEGTIYLCLDCNLKFEQAQSLEFDRLARQYNLVADEADMMLGMPRVGARYALPQRPVFHVGDFTLNNINIDRSTIGILNTGTIGTVDGAVTVLNEHGETEAGNAIARLTEAVVKAQESNDEQKNKILEILSVLATEGTMPKENRRSAAMKPLLLDLSTILGGIASLAQLWQQFGPMIVGLFQ